MNQSDKELAAMVAAGVETIALIDRAWVKTTFVKRLPKFYPRCDLRYKKTSTLSESPKRYDRRLIAA